MKIVISTLITGIIVGLTFHMLGLPIPAPSEFAGIAGMIGIYSGFRVVDLYKSSNLR